MLRWPHAPIFPHLAAQVPPLTFNNGVEIPQVGFGVFKVPPAETKAAVTSALEIGYRHIDTAKLYGNEAAVGEAIAESGIDRGDLFVTTKVWNDDQGHDATLRAFDASLKRLGLDHARPLPHPLAVPRPGPLRRDLEGARASCMPTGAFAASVSPTSSRRICSGCSTRPTTVPAINQVELHPWLQQRELRDFHAEHGIVTEAWSPISRGAPARRPDDRRARDEARRRARPR